MKKVMIAVLAIAVLFSFAACDNNPPASTTEGLDNLVVAMTVDYASGFDGKYFGGDKIDLNDYVITVEKYNGDTEVVTPDQVSFVDEDEAEFNGAANTSSITEKTIATIKYEGSTYLASTVTANVKGTVYKLDAINVTVNQAGTYYVGGDINDIKKNITVTGYALVNGATVYEDALDAEMYKISVATAVDGKFAVSGSNDFVVKDTQNADFAAVNKDAKLGGTVSVTPDAVTSVEIAQGGEGKTEAIIGASVSSKDASSYVTVTYTTSSGKKYIDSYPGATVEWDNASFTFAENAKYTVTVTIGSGDEAKKYTETVSPIKNYVKSFTINSLSKGAVLYLNHGDNVKSEITSVNLVWANPGASDLAQSADVITYLTVTAADGSAYTTIPSTESYGAVLSLKISFSSEADAVANGITSAECQNKVAVNSIKSATLAEIAKSFVDPAALSVTSSWVDDSNKPANAATVEAALKDAIRFVYDDVEYKYIGTDASGNVFLADTLAEGNVETTGEPTVAVASATGAITYKFVGEYAAVTGGTVSFSS